MKVTEDLGRVGPPALEFRFVLFQSGTMMYLGNALRHFLKAVNMWLVARYVSLKRLDSSDS